MTTADFAGPTLDGLTAAQKIRIAALYAAVDVTPLLYSGDDGEKAGLTAARALRTATQFEDYIDTGRTIPWPAELDPRLVPLTDEQRASVRSRLLERLKEGMATASSSPAPETGTGAESAAGSASAPAPVPPHVELLTIALPSPDGLTQEQRERILAAVTPALEQVLADHWSTS